jgi:hypothetical protein
VAKKSRTPAPPRRVQAPQRRTDPKRQRSPEDRRTLYMTIAFAASGVVLVAVVVVVIAVLGNGGSSAGKKIDTSKLIGLQTGPAPWNAGLDHVTDRLKPLGLNQLGSEGAVIHIHAHLEVFVNGKHEPVAQSIGVFGNQFLTELHTHDTAGVVHVESPTKQSFSLGQFLGLWGVRFTPKCIGGYCKPGTPWSVYVDGKLYPGDPTRVILKKHQELAVVIGTPPKKIPASYKFPAGE